MKKVFQYFLVMSSFFLLVLAAHLLRQEYRRHREEFSSYTPIAMDRVTEKKKFVIVIPSYCNEKYAEKNLRSVFEQNYDNYRVIYIDDHSTDRTVEVAKEVIRRFKMEERVTFIENSFNRGRTANDYYAIHSCANDEIIVCLDGDDWFAHRAVLSELNRYYNDENVWLTYGQTMTYPKYERCGGKEPLFNRLKTGNVRAHWHCFRYQEWIFNQPRTFYAGLFKRLKVKDLFYEGHFTKVVGDVAMMYPLLEMARGHSVFIPKVAYIYNKETPLSDGILRKNTQDKMYEIFFRKDPYPPLLEDPRTPIKKSEEGSAAIIVFSQNNPMGLYDSLHSLEKKLENKGEMIVFYTAQEDLSRERYALVQETFPSISFVEISQKESIKKHLSDFIKNSSSKYIFMTNDQLRVKNILDSNEAIYLLKTTGANAFFSSVDAKNLTPIAQGGVVWPLSKIYNTEMTLYPKKEVERILVALSAKTIEEFIQEWENCGDREGMGVSIDDSKAE